MQRLRKLCVGACIGNIRTWRHWLNQVHRQTTAPYQAILRLKSCRRTGRRRFYCSLHRRAVLCARPWITTNHSANYAPRQMSESTRCLNVYIRNRRLIYPNVSWYFGGEREQRGRTGWCSAIFFSRVGTSRTEWVSTVCYESMCILCRHLQTDALRLIVQNLRI